VAFALTSFGDRSLAALAADAPMHGWASGGLTYAGYNIIGAVVILPALRHMTSNRDAVRAGLLAGPLAMLPALLFFVCMIGWYPQIQGEALPSDFLLKRLDQPWFRLVFQAMIFSALLESGTGAVHAVNERIAAAWSAARGRDPGRLMRLGVASALLVVSIFIAARFGLVDLIAKGYRLLAWVFLGVYVAPLVAWAAWRGLRLTRKGFQHAENDLPN
jgi:uncharacterized membrane protein YkvI